MATDKLVDFDHVTDYISREAAIDAVDVCNLHRGIIDALQAIISDIPSADVRPVVRGEWEPNERHDDCLVCSKCGCGYPAVGYAFMDCNRRSDERESAVFITDIMNFCPNCGADMRETGNG